MIDLHPARRAKSLTRAFCLAGLVCLAAWSSAEAADPIDADLAEQIMREERDRELRVVSFGRARVSHPQEFSVAAGWIFSRQPTHYDCRTLCDFRGFLVQVEPGLGGGRLSAGYAVLNAIVRPDANFLSHIYLGYGIKGAVLRTWGDSNVDSDSSTRLGVEGDFTFIGINVSLGLFRHVGSGDPDDPWMVTGGLGWGF